MTKVKTVWKVSRERVDLRLIKSFEGEKESGVLPLL